MPRRLAIALAWLLACRHAGVADGTADHPPGPWTIGNAALELRLERNGDRVAATSLANRPAHRLLPLSSDDFALEFDGAPALHAADFVFRNAVRETIPGGQRLGFVLAKPDGTARVTVVYECRDNDFFLRRHLEVEGSFPRPLRRIVVWSAGLADRCSSQEIGPPQYLRDNVWGVEGKKGFGQPVLLADTFWGIEFPTGYNRYDGGIVTVSHSPGRRVDGRFASKTAVLGVAPAGQVAARFRSYIDQGRGRELRPRVQVDYNTWTTLMPATSSNCLQLAALIRTNLWDRHGVAFDSFTPDDGWDEKNSLWKIRTQGFPDGFAPLVEALRPMRTKLGLWLSPSSGYEHAVWGGRNGLARNATFDWFLCQSDPRYRDAMNRIVPELIRNNDVGFFKMDGFCASCDTRGHPHHLDGDAAREANVDAFVELIAAMRRANPDVYLDPTSGMWLSPWWLWHVDSIWCDTYDGTAPALVPSPNGLDGATTSRDALLRHRLAQNPGFDPGAIETLGVYLDPTLSIEPKTFFDRWQDNAVMVAGRGNRLLTFYMDPAHFADPPRDWAFLAGLIRWTREHAALLARTEMILGDPHRMEPYGYAHFLGSHGILTLRNPFIQPRTVRVKLDASAGWTAADAGREAYSATIVHPHRELLRRTFRHGDTLELELPPYQTFVLEIGVADPALAPFAGLRARELPRAAHRNDWELFGLPGTTVMLPAAGMPDPKAILQDGRPVRVVGNPSEPHLAVTFGGDRQPCAAEGGQFRVEGSGVGEGLLAGRCTVTVPRGATASMYVLCLDPSSTNAMFRCHATVGGAEVPVTAILSPVASRIPPRTLKELPPTPWVFFRCEVPAGRSEVAIALGDGSRDPKPLVFRAGWWLWIEQPLAKTLLSMPADKPSASSGLSASLVPTSMEYRRTILPLQPLQTFGSAPSK